MESMFKYFAICFLKFYLQKYCSKAALVPCAFSCSTEEAEAGRPRWVQGKSCQYIASYKISGVIWRDPVKKQIHKQINKKQAP